ncbi:MAG: DUF134 domain-containing protein [Prolixibacteraceae bacterium]|jgi:predicted DNA-binding protein (UPF0251 family)/DNA-directed RNA polymerase subunit RPC12/RpoP|nr:DUF134 domain-containing protein [Prolixibacteraceae bacterium]
MARPRKPGKIQMPPRAKAFMPVGYYKSSSEAVQLNIEEFEVFRLLDYEGLTQVEAAKLMQVSRSGVARIYEKARYKLAKALTEAKKINIEGGSNLFDNDWYECERCNSKFNNPARESPRVCPLCNSAFIHMVNN